MKKIIAVLIMVGLAFSTNAQEVTSENSRNKIVYYQYKKLVESGEFMFTANWVIDGKKREKLETETNRVNFKKGLIYGQLKSVSSDTTDLMLDEESTYGVFYSDESELIKIVFTVKNNNSVSHIKLEIKNGKVFLRIDGKKFSDTKWIGQLTAI
jgi:hypothetical protein